MHHNSCVPTGDMASPCVTWDEMKAHSRIDSEADKTLMEDYLEGADLLVRVHLGMALNEQEYTVRFPDFAVNEQTKERNGYMKLPIYPLVVDGEISVHYIGTDGTEGEVDDFQIDYWSKPGFICPLPGQFWPEVEKGRINPVRIVFPAGFAVVPKVYKQLVRLCAALWFEMRIPVTFEDIRKMPTPAGFDSMIWNLRVE